MAFIHGKGAYVSLGGVDLSAFTNNVEFGREADSHETTTFGKNSKTRQGGLLDGTCSVSGIYDDGATGPRATIEPLIGTVVPLVHRPEGTGTGKPQDTVSVLVQAYNETTPVGDMIAWSAELEFSDDVATADQV